MLRMNPFSVCSPNSLDETLDLLDKHGGDAKIHAGGTDILPNIKHELLTPKFLINIKNLKELKGVRVEDDTIIIGASSTLSELLNNKTLLTELPALCDAIRQIASPQIRNTGTIGGNICLDTRCLYYNQSHFWRESLGFCLKKDGDTCHVTKVGRKCVAAASNDSATVLLTRDTYLTINSLSGEKTIPLSKFYTANGIKNNVLQDDSLISDIRIKIDKSRRIKNGFSKLRFRKSIDFPLISLAVSFNVNDDDVMENCKLVINALAAKPKELNVSKFTGQKMKSSLVEEISIYASEKCMPLANISGDASWRKSMIAHLCRDAFKKAFNA